MGRAWLVLLLLVGGAFASTLHFESVRDAGIYPGGFAGPFYAVANATGENRTCEMYFPYWVSYISPSDPYTLNQSGDNSQALYGYFDAATDRGEYSGTVSAVFSNFSTGADEVTRSFSLSLTVLPQCRDTTITPYFPGTCECGKANMSSPSNSPISIEDFAIIQDPVNNSNNVSFRQVLKVTNNGTANATRLSLSGKLFGNTINSSIIFRQIYYTHNTTILSGADGISAYNYSFGSTYNITYDNAGSWNSTFPLSLAVDQTAYLSIDYAENGSLSFEQGNWSVFSGGIHNSTITLYRTVNTTVASPNRTYDNVYLHSIVQPGAPFSAGSNFTVERMFPKLPYNNDYGFGIARANVSVDNQVTSAPALSPYNQSLSISANSSINSSLPAGKYFVRGASAGSGSKPSVLTAKKSLLAAGKLRKEFGSETFSASLSAEEATSLASQGCILEPVKTYHIHDFEVMSRPSTTPTGIRLIGAQQVWNKTRAGEGITVAVLDTGISSHSDLQNSSARNITTVGVGIGTVDGHGHGTHVAGIIAANGDYNQNGTLDASTDEGIWGVAPNVSLLIIKVCDDGGSCTEDHIKAGIDRARVGYDNIENTADDADVISMSLGGQYRFSDTAYQSFKDAYSNGTVIVASAGNSGSGADSIRYPAAYPEVISVGSVNSAGTVAGDSSRGQRWNVYCMENPARHRCLDIVSYGVGVQSTWTGDSYYTSSGTSMAAPHVSGTVALLLANNSALTQEQVRHTLLSNAEPVYSSDWYDYRNVTFSARAAEVLRLEPFTWVQNSSFIQAGGNSYVKSTFNLTSNSSLNLTGLVYNSSLVGSLGRGGWTCSVTSGSMNVSSGSNTAPGYPILCNRTLASQANTSAPVGMQVVVSVADTVAYSNITANVTLGGTGRNDSYAVLSVSIGGWQSIKPNRTADCNSSSPTYSSFPLNSSHTFLSCIQDLDADNSSDYFRWVQPHSETLTYKVGWKQNNSRPCLADDDCNSSICLHSVCRPTSPYCGDGYCDSGEDHSSCPADCEQSIDYRPSPISWDNPPIQLLQEEKDKHEPEQDEVPPENISAEVKPEKLVSEEVPANETAYIELRRELMGTLQEGGRLHLFSLRLKDADKFFQQGDYHSALAVLRQVEAEMGVVAAAAPVAEGKLEGLNYAALAVAALLIITAASQRLLSQASASGKRLRALLRRIQAPA